MQLPCFTLPGHDAPRRPRHRACSRRTTATFLVLALAAVAGTTLPAQTNPPVPPEPSRRYAIIDLKGFLPSRLNNKAQIVGKGGVWQGGQVFGLRGGGTPADINDHGVIVGTARFPTDPAVYPNVVSGQPTSRAARWASVIAEPEDLGAFRDNLHLPASHAVACGNNGVVVGGAEGVGLQFDQAVRFPGVQPVNITPSFGSPAPYGYAVGASRDGSQWTGYISYPSNGSSQTPHRANRSAEVLSVDGTGNAINAAGFVVGYGWNPEHCPVVFEPGSTTKLNLPLGVGATASNAGGHAEGVNDAVGWNAQGKIVPNPEIVGAVWTEEFPDSRARHWRKDLVRDQYVVLDLNDAIAPGQGWRLKVAHAVNDAGVIVGVGTYTDPATPGAASQERGFLLAPMTIEGHKRGTIDAPGPQVAPGEGEYGQETVMLENADSDVDPSRPDYSTNADAPGVANRNRDDDFVEVVLRWPKGVRLSGSKLELKHLAMAVNGAVPLGKNAVTEYDPKMIPSRLNFYKPDGTKLTDSDLIIPDLGSPGSGYLAQILATGELKLFIEGKERFGSLGKGDQDVIAAERMGGAMLNFEFTAPGGKLTRQRLLVYRGGFLLYRQQNGRPGTSGPLMFYDGKGRVNNDVTDYGNRLTSWTAISGKTTGAGPNVSGGNGHIPPGWRVVFERLDFSESQRSQTNGKTGRQKLLRQGGYCRWKQDDETDAANRYITPFVYNGANTHDYAVGEPEEIRFKFQTEVIAPTSAANRSEIQIHPDGRRDGTLGCIGIQSYRDCKEVLKVSRIYHNLKLKVESTN